MKLRILLLAVLIVLPHAVDAATIIFFENSQAATLLEAGDTSDTIGSNGYRFTFSRDKLFLSGTGRHVRVPWPEGVEAQAVTVGRVRKAKARISISRVDGKIFAISAFTIKLLANTVGAGGAIEVMPQLNDEDGYKDPIFFLASGIANQTYAFDTASKRQSTSLLSGFDTYTISLYVDFALTAITLIALPH